MSYYTNMCENEKEVVDDPLATIGMAVGVVAGAAFAAWAVSKLLCFLIRVAAFAAWGVSMLFYFLIRVAAFAAWGVSKLFSFLFRVSKLLSSSSESSSSSNKKVMEPLEEDDYICNQVHEPSFPLVPEGKGEKWSVPQKGWWKLNTDASLGPPESIGGVIRNGNGVWVVGFAGKIQGCAPHPELAELWAIRTGLMTAQDWGFNKIEIETDSQAALGLLKEEKVSNDLRGQLIKGCRDLIGRILEVKVEHCPEKANKVAHKMADLGHGPDFHISYFSDQNKKVTYFFTPPEEVVLQLHYERDLED